MAASFIIRPHRVGDLGWVFMRQAEIYTQEFGYLPVFETYVAKGLAPFLERFDAAKDALWVAEADGAGMASSAPSAPPRDRPADGAAGRPEDAGRRLGAVAIQHDADRPGWAQLRWYFVEKRARGAGVGRALLDHALRFCREAGYEGVFLGTCSDLDAARRQYERAGFTMVREDKAPCSWAPWAREQWWEMTL